MGWGQRFDHLGKGDVNCLLYVGWCRWAEELIKKWAKRLPNLAIALFESLLNFQNTTKNLRAGFLAEVVINEC
jgi:hypothetical protein